jgi:hypothetical protein
MIIDLLLNLVKSIIDWVASVRPAWEVHLPAGVANLIAQAKGLDALLPITEITTVLGLIVTLFTVMLSWKFIVWGARRIIDVIP